jgi:8-oxo-dGTP pyrophosphatase MutT (NUDIX family)
VSVRWLSDGYEPPPELDRRADAAIADLRRRGSPAHDGLSARLAGWKMAVGRLSLELQPSRWALRLVGGVEGVDPLTALCVVRSEDGRWLAGRRAAWLSTWAGRWALGAGGAVDVGESPVDTLARELREEWRLEPLELSAEALVALSPGLVGLLGLAVVPGDANPVPDAEHDELAWWPADVERWPAEADERLRLVGRLLAG